MKITFNSIHMKILIYDSYIDSYIVIILQYKTMQTITKFSLGRTCPMFQMIIVALS